MTAWPSLTCQIDLAAALPGPHRAAALNQWFDQAWSRRDDLAFARLFSDHIDLPGIQTDDYLHRYLTTSRGRLLGGIRFYGQDISRPFVEVVAHTFERLEDLATATAAEWHAFRPTSLRVTQGPDASIPSNAWIDTQVYVAPLNQMAAPDPAVTLTSFDRIEDAWAMVADRYRALREDGDPLARNLSPADPDDLRNWHDEGTLHAIRQDKEIVGLFAAAPGQVEWIDGWEVNEEVVPKSKERRGLATAAQTRFAADRPGEDTLMIGTIDALNAASRRSAEKAGRNAVLTSIFVPLSLDG